MNHVVLSMVKHIPHKHQQHGDDNQDKRRLHSANFGIKNHAVELRFEGSVGTDTDGYHEKQAQVDAGEWKVLPQPAKR